MMLATDGPNRIVPSAPQVPPVGEGASASGIAGPPLRSRRSSFPLAKKPIDLLSGDQNGHMPPSVAGIALASAWSSARSQSRDTPASDAL